MKKIPVRVSWKPYALPQAFVWRPAKAADIRLEVRRERPFSLPALKKSF